MSSYKERFLSSLENINSRRAGISHRKKLDTKKENEECVNRFFSTHKPTLINSTLNYVLSEMENESKLPPYILSYTLQEFLSSKQAPMLANKIKAELLENLPGSRVTVSVKDKHIQHGHESSDSGSGAWIYDYTEHKVIVTITVNF